MRFIVVLVDATEENAIEVLEQRNASQEPTELLFLHELTETAAFVRKELANKRMVDAVIFVFFNMNFVNMILIYQAVEELKKDPLTRQISCQTLGSEQVYEVLYLDQPVVPGVPQPLVDMMLRKQGAPKLPN